MENESLIEFKAELPDVDFEKLRCSKCSRFLNCPPVMVFQGRDNYAECGRCFNAEAAQSEGLHPIRNRSLELLASITPFPCKNSEGGCTERRTWPQIETHESQCLHRTFNCPLLVLKSCTFKGEVESLVDHFRKEHSELLLIDGAFNEAFDKDFENHYLVKQNHSLFVFQIKYELNTNKAWFVVNVLEEKNGSEFKLEFTSETSPSSFVTKHKPIFTPVTVIDVNKAAVIDIQAIKTLLKEPNRIKCKVSLSIRLPALHPFDLLKEIRCPVCWDFMKGKIFLCDNGHNICSKCKEFSVHCPTCRVNILDIRNFSLEKLVAYALFPCKNYYAGCNYVATLDDIIYHFDHCSLTPTEAK